MDMASLGGIQAAGAQNQAPVSSVASISNAAQGLSPHDPVYVSMVDGGFKSNMWKTVRSLAVAFLVVSALGAILDEKVGKFGSPSKIMGPTGSDKKFSDVKGAAEAKEELQEIVQFLKVTTNCCRKK
jgi:ATP-dependent metalloprotease